MASPYSLKEERCFEWKTEKPDGNSIRESPTFTFQGCDCSFTFTYRTTPGFLGDETYLLYGRRRHNLRVPFDVTVYIVNEGRPVSYKRRTVSYASRLIWEGSRRDITRQFPGFVSQSFVIFRIIFHSDSGIYVPTRGRASDLPIAVPDSLDAAAAPLDIQLKCDGGNVPASGAVLAERSQVLLAILQANNTLEGQSVVDMTDVPISIVRLFLKFLYTGKIEDLQVETASCLYQLGEKYEVFPLARTCSDWMIKNLSIENYVSYLDFANAHNDEYMKNAVIGYITEHVEELMAKTNWLIFAARHVKEAFQVLERHVKKSS